MPANIEGDRLLKLKLTLTLSLSLLYLIIYIAFEPGIGPSAGLLAAIPVVVAAWSFGMRVGALSGLLVAIGHGAFQYFTHDPRLSWITIVLTFIAASLAGGAVGRLRDQGEALRRWDAELERRVQEQTAELSRLIDKLQHEINERRQVEAALRSNEDRFRAVLENSNELIVILSAEGHIKYATPTAYRIMGYTPETPPSRSIVDLIHPEDLPRLEEGFSRLLQNPGRLQPASLYRVRDSQGEWRVIEVLAVNLLEDPAVRGIVANGYDITERKLAEAAVAEKADEIAKLYRASTQLLPSTNDVAEICERIAETIVEVFALPHCTVWLVDEAAKMLRQVAEAGDDKVEFMTLPLDGPGLTVAAARSGEIVCIPDVTVDPRYIRGREDTRSELVVPLKVGSRIIGAINLESPDFNAYTERHQRIVGAFAERAALALENTRLVVSLEEAVKRANELAVAAEEASQIKGQFLTNTSHELRTPLTSIIGSLDIVMNNLFNSREDERELVRMAFESAQGLESIVDDLLEIAKIEAGDVELRTQVTAIGPILNEIHALNRAPASKKGLSLEIAEPNVSALVYADSDKLRRILLNIVGNGIKFTEAGGVTVSVDSDKARERMIIKVKDTGIGVPPEVQPKLFQPFFQADGSTTRRYGGTGLGLTIARRLAEMMGGTLTLYSAGEGQGTTMTLTLPMAEVGRD